MKKIVQFFFLCIICNGARAFSYSSNNLLIEQIDSVSYVANRIMNFNVYINSYEISDAELDWVEKDHPNWIVSYFPVILTTYDCTLYTQFSLAASIHMKGNSDYLYQLWDKYGYLFEVNGHRNEEYTIQQIWGLFDWLHINPKALKKKSFAYYE